MNYCDENLRIQLRHFPFSRERGEQKINGPLIESRRMAVAAGLRTSPANKIDTPTQEREERLWSSFPASSHFPVVLFSLSFARPTPGRSTHKLSKLKGYKRSRNKPRGTRWAPHLPLLFLRSIIESGPHSSLYLSQKVPTAAEASMRLQSTPSILFLQLSWHF